ncbi:hypothetical protein [Candidatus Igneacidithiobacillus taiwanensis]|uniref:hypothetical protein n=1 Tax=Candidatus Igneacidithiobacillus taiwanensis TaxID=1945924 RepID=UPI0028A1734B|nr:hypothetical protein [Candidatus Igneacidithiobacillus taiwanensis]MCE5359600.1 hypothetical protein [Acidithiobacillus sp.]
MKKPKRSSVLLFLFLILWAVAMVGLVIIGFTNIQPSGIGNTGAISAPARSNT